MLPAETTALHAVRLGALAAAAAAGPERMHAGAHVGTGEQVHACMDACTAGACRPGNAHDPG